MIASAEEISAWLSNTVTTALGDELRKRLDDYRRSLAGYVIKGDEEKSRALAGAIKAYEEFLAEFFVVPDAEAPPEPDNYRDPASLEEDNDGAQ
jgi:hypothetical protein